MTSMSKMPKPERVFAHFAAICAIPHGSSNTKALSDYVADFARQHGKRCVQDEANNVIVYLDATGAMADAEPAIIQGHLDMVCDQTEECTKDLRVDGLDLCSDGEYVFADGTTLGGDDGIAIAYMLTLIEDDSIPHPPLELLFTSDEEIGMIGAKALDADLIHARTLINIDSEIEGVLTVSCAGGIRAVCSIPFATEAASGVAYTISFGGLRGGHSGIEIHTGRVNANKLMGRMLNYLAQSIDFRIVTLKGGRKYNAIPNEAEVTLCLDPASEAEFCAAAERFCALVQKEKASNEPTLAISATPTPLPERCMDVHSTRKVLFTLLQIPDGVQTMSPDIPDMVQTSLNMGILETNADHIALYYLIRSSAATGKQAMVHKVKSFVEYLDGTVTFASDYPAWEYKPDSRLRTVMVETYRTLYGEEPIVTAIHAGLECGILAGKLPYLDAVSYGPNILGAHTPQEKMEIASVERCWDYLCAVLKNLK